MTGMQDVDWGPTTLEPVRNREVEREVRRSLGTVPEAVRLFAPVPWMARGIAQANLRAGLLAHLDFNLAELIFLAVSQDNSCRYCYQSQRSLLRILGIEEDRIRRLEEAAQDAESNLAEKRCLDFARRISRSNPPPSNADWDGLREVGYSDDAIREIIYVAARTAAANRITTFPAMPLADSTHDRGLLVRLFRPLLARVLLSRSRAGDPEFLSDERKSEPFAYVAFALDGLPAGCATADLALAAWSSPALPQRAKALIYAVVARGLGSKRMELEAVELLAERGLDPDTVEDALSHLASPKLDPLESLVVPFARETIWYRPEDIQRRARELRSQLSVEQFLELIGVSALANSQARLSLSLVERE